MGPGVINWRNSVKYLGVHLVSGESISFALQLLSAWLCLPATLCFSNCASASELMHLTLYESLSSSVVKTYAMSAIDLRSKVSELNAGQQPTCLFKNFILLNGNREVLQPSHEYRLVLICTLRRCAQRDKNLIN